MPSSHTSAFRVEDIPNLSGYVAIVTGGNSGIGYETSLQLALRHARVYVAGRSRERLMAAIEKMKGSSKVPSDMDLHVLEMDLQNLRSVRAAAEDFMKKEARLDLLINNAGIMAVPYKLTADGFESQWQTNHLAPHFLFTCLLPILKSTAAASASKTRVRVVNVSSDAAFFQAPKEINYADPNLESASGTMASWRRYGHSKLASIVDTQAMHNRFFSSGISFFSVNPGVVKTNLQAANPTLFGSMMRVVVRVAPFVLSAPDGARTTLFCATSQDAIKSSGKFHVPFGKVDRRADRLNNDDGAVAKLWEESEKMLRTKGL